MTDCYRHPGTEATFELRRVDDWEPTEFQEPDPSPIPVCLSCAEMLIEHDDKAAALVDEI